DNPLVARLAVPESTTQIAGLSLYYAGEQKGYLLASELNKNRFWVYERLNNELIADFAINAHNQIDAVEHTEAFAVTNISLNATFPQGLLIVQDNYNPGFAANYKFIAWERLAQELNLVTDSSFDPSQLGFLKPQVQTVQATVETAPVAASGDAADDLAIWVHPQDPALSTVIGTQKKGGLVVYDLQGQQLQYLAEGRLNNVDLRDQFPLGSETITLVAASNRSNNQIALYQVDPVTRHLVALATRPITVGLKREAYGLCLYHDLKNHHYYVFVNDKTGSVEQWQLFANDHNQVEGRLVRQFSVGSQTEGCVVDDVQAYLFIGEENVAIWRYSADPQADETRIAVDTTRGGHLTADIEGLTLYQGEQHHGYLLASSQGNNQFNLYNRTQPHHYLGSFRIGANAQIDGVADTDGIEAVSVPLGRHFPSGLFAVQDGRNPPENQNFKLIPWEAIADQFHLLKK
ncbi:MAG: phytase, partial [Pseudomonadota bacterium]|nr:phytase [Pseudomonadota bacterium]